MLRQIRSLRFSASFWKDLRKSRTAHSAIKRSYTYTSMTNRLSYRLLLALLTVSISVFSVSGLFADTTSKKKSSGKKIAESPTTQKKISRLKHSRPVVRHARHHRYYDKFYTSSFSTDNTEGDVAAGEDPIVRAAAIEALGNMNGSVVAIDPDSGRVLAMVNQKLALSEGAQPCSTIKLVTSLAALNEGIVDKDTEVPLSKRWKMTLTHAIATSNNTYFEVLG